MDHYAIHLIRKGCRSSTKRRSLMRALLMRHNEIKNPTSLGAKAVKAVQAKHRFALTGTPIENTLSELWSIFDFVMPGFFLQISTI